MELRMQTFLKIFGFLAAVVIVIGLFLSNKVDVRRSVEINAPASSIHKFTNDLIQWSKWSPWLTQDPTIKTTLGKITQGVGASQSWKGQSGNGELTFIESSPQTGVKYNMQFDGDRTIYLSGLSYQTDGYKTTVTWYMTGEMEPIIIGNYFAQLMDGFVGDSFTQGLEKLKLIAEQDAR